jgi:hypothetical protein
MNRIVSWPVPAAQPLIAVLLFAAVIASRREQMPAAPGSASELTTIVAAQAAVLNAIPNVIWIAALRGGAYHEQRKASPASWPDSTGGWRSRFGKQVHQGETQIYRYDDSLAHGFPSGQD